MSKRQRRKMPSADVAVLTQPPHLGTSDAALLAKALRDGTSEVQHVLVNECSAIIECRVCRGLFRSVADLLAHKRQYCRASCSNRAATSSKRNAETAYTSSLAETARAPSSIVGQPAARETPRPSASNLQQTHAAHSASKISRRDSASTTSTTGRGYLAKRPDPPVSPEEAVDCSEPRIGLTTDEARSPFTAAQEPPSENSSRQDTDSVVLDPVDTISLNNDDHCTADICMLTWQCFTCHLALGNSYEMRRHLVYGHGTEVRYHICPQCGFEREYFFEVMRHLHTAHGLAAEQLASLRNDVQNRVRYRSRQYALAVAKLQCK